VPEAPEETVNQFTLLVAVHEQPVGTVPTATLPVPPEAGAEALVGEML
jgi:hypothetical protein